MTRYEFKYAMQRGLGRCITVLKNEDNIEKYKDIILYGCLKEISFDAQCEGTRASYLYDLALCYEDEGYFFEPIAESLQHIRPNKFWLFCQYCELLMHFAKSGNLPARKALLEKYDDIYEKIQRTHTNSFNASILRDCYEILCIVLTSLDGIERFISISSNIGEMFEKSKYTGNDFMWFIEHGKDELGEKRVIKRLIKESYNSKRIASFYSELSIGKSVYSKEIKAQVPSTEDIIKAACNNTLSASLKFKFIRNAKLQEKQELAKYATSCNNLDIRANILSVFAKSGYPGVIEELISDFYLGNENLKNVVIDVLERSYDSKVKEFALNLIEDKEYRVSAICMLITNYNKNHKELLLNTIYSIPVSYSETNGWHKIVMHIIWAFKSLKRKSLPVELLYYVYENSICSNCRESAVRILVKKRLLTSDILNECIYDSNESIREYACNIIKRRNIKY